MNIRIFGKNTKELEDLVKEKGVSDLDFVITNGGDGTFLAAENKFPEIPKLILRDGSICKLCIDLEKEEIFERVRKGRYRIDEINKVEAVYKDKKLTATNEIIIHNGDPRHAIRYEVFINDKKVHDHDVIGDGVVVSTLLGATGYYRSITDSVFHTGIGLAFNNSTEPYDHIVLDEKSEIKIKIKRGPAVVYADNQEECFDLKEGDEIIVKKSEEKTRLVRV
jgi:NAD kinase